MLTRLTAFFSSLLQGLSFIGIMKVLLSVHDETNRLLTYSSLDTVELPGLNNNQVNSINIFVTWNSSYFDWDGRATSED